MLDIQMEQLDIQWNSWKEVDTPIDEPAQEAIYNIVAKLWIFTFYSPGTKNKNTCAGNEVSWLDLYTYNSEFGSRVEMLSTDRWESQDFSEERQG